MRTLNLDYCHRTPLLTATGLLWMLLGLTMLGAVLAEYTQVRNALARQEDRIDTLNEDVNRKVKARERLVSEAKHREPELKEARAVLRRLAIPWENVFAALEGATRVHRNRIRILGLQPDAERSLVLLTGEADDLGDLMDYLERLGSSGALRRARLVNHRIHVDLPRRPVRFTAVAEWVTGS